MRPALFLLLAAALGGCAAMGVAPGDVSTGFGPQARASDLRAVEDQTRSGLGQIEAAIADYYREKNQIPPSLDSLVPRYLAAIPTLDLPACGRPSDQVRQYAPSILRDGRVVGSAIRGSGHWGYVFNDSQVIVFVDCRAKSSRGVPWYEERGVY